MSYRRHWITLAVVLAGGFLILGSQEPAIRESAPPIPTKVVAASGQVLIDTGAITRGQNVWQSIGGQEVGSIWGHGAYVAPDWGADWLHREAVFMLERYAAAEGGSYASLPAERQAALRERLRADLRSGNHDPATGVVTLSPERAAAFEDNAAHYASVFRDGVDAYAIPRGALDRRGPGPRHGRLLLVDQLGLRRRAARQGRELHAELAPRAAGRATSPPAGRWCGASSPSCSCWPASAAWCGGRAAARSRARWRPASPTATRSSASTPRPRSAPR